MEKLRPNDLIDFRRRDEKRKHSFKSFIENRERVQKEKKENRKKGDKDGGNYWVSCVSAIESAFKENNKQLLSEKIRKIQIKLDSCTVRTTQLEYQANINVLYGFQDFDFEEVIPRGGIEILHQTKDVEILDIQGLPIKANPSIIFLLNNGEQKEIGAVSFIALKGGFKKSELGIFTETYFRYLTKNYGEDYTINPHYLIAVDVVDVKLVRYEELLNGDVSPQLENTIEEIKKFVQ